MITGIFITKIKHWLSTHKLLSVYLFASHVLLVALVLTPDLAKKVARLVGKEHPNTAVSHKYQSLKTMLARIDKNTNPNRVVFIGDSLIQGMAVNSITPKAVNYGIGHDTISGVAQRIRTYQAVQHAHSIVLAVGVNDLRKHTIEESVYQYKNMLKWLPGHHTIYIHTVLPVDAKILGETLQQKIVLFNKALYTLTSELNHVKVLPYAAEFIDRQGNLKPALHIGDGLHLSPKGYEIWIKQLKSQVINSD